MSRKAFGGLALVALISLCLPVQAEEAKVTIIRPPPLAVKIAPPSEASAVSQTGAYKPINQAVTVTIVTNGNPYYGDRYRWWGNPRRIYTSYGFWGGTAIYGGPRYPF